MNRVLMSAVIAVFSVCVFIQQLHADVINITEGSISGYTMMDGNTYVIQNSVSFLNSTAGGSGMTVADGATVVLYVPSGVTLTAIGANGSGRTGGGAGIRVSETSTLVITGEGTVNATGGNAGNGGNGEAGSSAYVKYDAGAVKSAKAGSGGMGGTGGGGAGAGIGGKGGLGGSPNNGSGGNGESMGTVYVLGLIRVEVLSGMSGVAGAAGTSGSGCYYMDFGKDNYVSGGGGGGGGGAGSSPMSSICGGGSAGGAGGGGLDGVKESNCTFVDSGAKGGGGGSLTDSGHGSYGRSGGAAGAEGDAGTLYVSPTATVNVDREKLTTTSHTAAQYVVTFDANGGEFQSSIAPITVTLGCELPEDIPIPHKGVSRFVGWSYDKDGGMMVASVYTMPANVTLYAVWEPLYPVFTPVSGTVFEDSLSVSISCLAEGATIHYTTDGSEPTIDSPVYRRFRINGKTTVKAIAEENGLLSEVVTAEYALGQCEDPIITPSDGATFEWTGEQVSIGKQGDEGVLRYTTDGSEPTRESPVYDGPFAISDSTVVKAKVFSDKFFDSAVVTANITRVWTDVAKPKIEALNSFIGSKTRVVMSCSTEGAVIHYTLDGGEPNSHSTKYTGPFYVSSSCTVKAYARKQDYRDSSVEVYEIVKVWGIGDTMGKPDHGFTTSGAGGLGWTRVADAMAPNGEAMKSGAIAHKQSSLLETKVMGPGTLTFSWRTSCEDSGGYYDWDHVEVSVDGEVRLKRDGINTWAAESIRIEGDGEHTVMWAYIKDDVESAGDDAAYVAGYGWVSDYTETKTTQVPVPYAWLKQCDSEIVDEFDAYESAALAMAKNGLNKVWECYVAGISPTNAESRFTAKIEFKDGAPIVTWKPDLNTNGIVRTYKIYGSETLENGGEWLYPTNSLHRFFKVKVEMP